MAGLKHYLFIIFCLYIVTTTLADRNVLHIVFDDFRPDLPTYGQHFVSAPHLTKFANKSLVFDRAYCQIAVCSPSRNSFMTGRAPNTTGVWNFFNSFREARCEDTLREGVLVVGNVLSSWTEADPQQSGGVGGCCTSCTGASPNCTAWTYVNKTCTLFSSVARMAPCPAPMPVDPRSGQRFSCVTGGPGTFPTFTSLPQRFKEAGFLTMGVGKLFHDGGYGFGGAPAHPQYPAGPGTPPLADPLSWSNVSAQYPSGCKWTQTGHSSDPTRAAQTWEVSCKGLPAFHNAYPPNPAQRGSAYLTPAGQGACDCHDINTTCMSFATGVDKSACTMATSSDGEGLSPPLLDVPVFKEARRKLGIAATNLRERGQPFYMAVGIKRPHLVWKIPQPIVDDHYPRGRFTPQLPTQRVLHQSIDPIAWTPFFTHKPSVPLTDNHTQELRRFYYAAITWADYCVGQVLDELSALNLTQTTAVIIHADHGWHLGEYNMWEKRTVWELGTRVPLMVHVPWMPQSHGRRTAAPVELLDVYPTLLDLLGVSAPAHDTHALEGHSWRPLLENPGLPVLPDRPLARSTYPRCPKIARPEYDDACIHAVERGAFPFMGYTIRTTKWRFTAWYVWNGTALAPRTDVPTHSVELYDHREDVPGGAEWEGRDGFEDVNVAVENPAVVEALEPVLRSAFGLV